MSPGPGDGDPVPDPSTAEAVEEIEWAPSDGGRPARFHPHDPSPLPPVGRLVLVLFPLLLVLPFDPQWPDFERARRGLLLVLSGLFLLFPGRGPALGPSRLFAPLLALPLLSLLSGIWAHDLLACFETGSYLLALALVPLLVPQGRRALRPLGQGIAMALCLTSIYGLAQSLGLDWPLHYTSPQQPVSSLGNTNVAAEWTAMAAPLALFAGPVPGLVSVLLGDLYLWTNGGRAALIGFHLCFVLVLLRPWEFGLGRRGRIAITVVLLLAPLPTLLGSGPAEPATTDAGAGSARADTQAGDTLAVRFRIYRRVAFDMLPDALPLGIGAGNFRVQFPHYRDPEEIAISSRDGRITTRVTTAHNDVLQLLVELGLPGAVFLTLFLVQLFRLLAAGRMLPLAMAALLAFLPLVGSRAPLYNASAALCFLLALQLSLEPSAARPWCRFPRWVLPLLGLLLLFPGGMMLAGESLGAGFLRAQAEARATSPEDPAYAARLDAVLSAIDTAVARDPLEPDWRLLRAQILRRNAADLNRLHPEWGGVELIKLRALHDLERVLDRRPLEYMALAEVGMHGLEDFRRNFGQTDLRVRSRAAIDKLLELYPGHPLGTDLHERFEGYRRIIEAARSPRFGEVWKAGRELCARLLAADPGDGTLQHLDLLFRLASLSSEDDVPVILERLAELDSVDLVKMVLSRLQDGIGKAEPRSLALLLRIKERVRSFAHERWPGIEEFR